MNSSGGYKTKQRQAILDYLIDNKTSHVTVSNISEHLEKEGARVGVTTIYRHLDKLLEQGLVERHQPVFNTQTRAVNVWSIFILNVKNAAD